MGAKINHNEGDTLSVNIAIVGGGRACNFFLKLLQSNSFPFLRVNIVGVCDIDPEAVGLRTAREMGIYTTEDFRDFFTSTISTVSSS